ncbi:mitochondrial protein import protein ZIM17 [Mytilus galloprovincialis]|uniref:Mitochondrial protein import protein ZIM17 n=1 Tax=Mytilus galloprovincialis TaxID=29158 RepID=A0A8B6CJT0_MYTGA|nr:mitochondrial protein import protein ZIM17 [Mytilus galloprovincialis]
MNPVRIFLRNAAIKEANRTTYMCNNKCNRILRTFSLKSGIQTSLQSSNTFKKQLVDGRFIGNFSPKANRILCSPRYYSSEQEDEGQTQSNQTLGKIKGTLLMAYKCKVCGTKNQETFSKQAYEKGVVIVTCKECKSNHLIADHLGWFQDFKGRTIEEILAEKGETVKKVVLDGGMELIPKN